MFKKQISRKIVAVSFTILLLLSGCGADMKGGTQAGNFSTWLKKIVYHNSKFVSNSRSKKYEYT